MLLPTKHLSPARSLLGVGASILSILTQDSSPGELWNHYRETARIGRVGDISYNWFLLALSFLYATSQIDITGGLLVRTNNND